MSGGHPKPTWPGADVGAAWGAGRRARVLCQLPLSPGAETVLTLLGKLVSLAAK